jgi:NTE family protein
MASRRTESSASPTVAVVLSGAGARGAFQAGALAELIPALEREGLSPTIWLGTSAGSINTVLWGSAAHLGAEAAAEEVLGVWRQMNEDDVYRPLLPFALARTGLQFAAGALLGVGPGTTSLLDTAPLRRTAVGELHTGQLAANVAAGVLAAVGVVATRMPAPPDSTVVGAGGGRSVIFLDGLAAASYEGDLVPDHVLASSAIPVAFPPVQLTEPTASAGWYVDGGVRLNTPLNPAVALGATKIVLISATATTYAPPPPPDLSGRTPDVADAAAQVMHAALADRTTEDLAALLRTNRLVAQATGAGHHHLLTGSTGRAYRQIDVLAVSPPPGEMGQIAAQSFDRRTGGLGRLTELDNWLLGQAIRGAGDGVGRRELLSYLFFDEDYFAAGIELGRKTASDALSRGWQS